MSLKESAGQAALEREVGSLRRKLRKAENTKVNLEGTIRDAAYAAFSSMEFPKIADLKKDTRRKSEEWAVVNTADWQLHKITPSYNAEVCKDRIVEQYASKIEEITAIQREDHPVKNAAIRFLGDIVEGEQIFAGQEYHLGAGLTDQIIGDGPDIAIALITRLLKTFEKLKITMVPGNHGRIGRPGQFDPDTNADRILYLVVQKWFQAMVEGGALSEDRIEWDVPRAFSIYNQDPEHPGTFAFETLGNYKSLLVHGDQFRGGNSFAGLPYYSFASKALRWRDMALAGELPEFNDIYCGHWHTDARVPAGFATVRVVGSPESTNLWSMETLAKSSGPTQLLTFVHPEVGEVTAEYVVRFE